MAAPSGQMKASRYLLVLGVIIVGLYALVFVTGDRKSHPKLGLDLKGGTSLTLTATNQADGKPPTASSLNLARQIIANRVNGSGVTEAEVVTEGRNNILVSAPCAGCEEDLRKLVAPAALAFRKVITQGQDHPVNPNASPTPSTSGSASASASASASPSASPSKTPSASPSASASASAAGSGSPAANPAASASAAAAAAKLAEIQRKLGNTWTLAERYVQQVAQGQAPPPTDAQTLAVLAPFERLDSIEVAALPPLFQFYLPTVTCKQLNHRDPGSIGDASAQVIACEQGEDAHTKYALDVAKMLGTDVATASNSYDTNNGGWHVSLTFTSKGQTKWQQLTQEISDAGKQNQNGQPAQLAIVLDNEVVSAPTVTSTIVGDAIINGGGINQQTSAVLANQLKYGALPLNFKVQSVDSVSATLGLQQLKYGLIAGAIGLILVIGYCLFYYRALGLAVIASLVVSASIVFASIVLLGRVMGFTLSLAGIAGFIVAIGITADSFVVFFERLKDEVKEGRTVRSSVPRAWIRARRTILSADAVSFLAAAILYWLAAGQVKGFAFTLGLSTIIDLIVVFLFTHPLVALLARSSAFTSPRVSGLGNMRSDRDTEAARSAVGRFGAVRTKES